MITPRERMLATFDYAHPDKIPVVYHGSPAGLHVHGQKLLDLLQQYPPDNPIAFDAIPHPPPDAVDELGRYHEFRTDGWGTTWEWRIFGLYGHPKAYPIADMQAAQRYEFPPLPAIGSPAFEAEQAQVERERREYLVTRGGLSLFERLCALYPMDRALMDLASGDRDMLAFLDRLVEYWLQQAAYYLALGVDGIWFADDWGTQYSQLVSPALFRRVFTPRYRALMEPIQRAGVKVFFHTCGYLGPILDELLDLEISLVWPQLSAYDDEALARKLYERRVTTYIHPDRQRLIPLGAPAEIEAAIRRYADRYHRMGGGGIFYVEIENDAPFENVQALIESVARYR